MLANQRVVSCVTPCARDRRPWPTCSSPCRLARLLSFPTHMKRSCTPPGRSNLFPCPSTVTCAFQTNLPSSSPEVLDPPFGPLDIAVGPFSGSPVGISPTPGTHPPVPAALPTASRLSGNFIDLRFFSFFIVPFLL